MAYLFRHWTRNLFEVGDRFVKLHAEPIEKHDAKIAEVEAQLKLLKERRQQLEASAKREAKKFWTTQELEKAINETPPHTKQSKEARDLAYLELIRGNTDLLQKFLIARHKGFWENGTLHFPTVFDKQEFENEYIVYQR